MKYVNLGSSGLRVSALCLGTWHLPTLTDLDEYGVRKVDEELFLRIAKRAYDLGINFYDTSNRYHGGMAPVDLNHVGNAEKILGKFLAMVERESVVLATKVRGMMAAWQNGEGLSRKHIRWQVKQSLMRLGTSHIDLYQLHWPDPSTPKLETLRTLNYLIEDGTVDYIGMSNYPASEMVEFMEIARKNLLEGFITAQDLYNVIDRDLEREKSWILQKNGMSVLAYSPLAQGVLSGKYVDFASGKWKVPQGTRAETFQSVKRYFTDKNLNIMKELREIAASKGATMTQVSLAWLMSSYERLGFITVPIVGVTTLEQLEENVASIGVNLSSDDLKRIDEVSHHSRRLSDLERAECHGDPF
ncbi:MAG: aldo/keto reductase [Thermoprotei archaeon]